jgi:aspartyl-tRNA synthetase
MLTSIEHPILENFKIRLDGDSKTVQKFIREFMDSPEAEPFKQNVDGAPGIFVFDPRRPLEGLQAFGFEGAESLKDIYAEEDALEDGDLLLVQARPNLPHTGGATMIGKLRLAIYKAALARQLVQPDLKHHFLWVTDFPMFTANNSSDPGQGGSSGFSATHHPFTAPKTSEDLDLLLREPLKAKADHYDLVLNGVELGGGSRRIHSSAIQNFIMKDILQVSD